MSAVQVRVQFKNVCYTSNLVEPKAHNTIHVNKTNLGREASVWYKIHYKRRNSYEKLFIKF